MSEKQSWAANSTAASWISPDRGHHWILPTPGSFLSLIFPDLLRACLLAYSRSFKLEINIYQQTRSAPSVASADRILGCKASPSGFGSMAFCLQPPALCWKSLVCCHSDTGSLYDAISCLSVSLPCFPFPRSFWNLLFVPVF